MKLTFQGKTIAIKPAQSPTQFLIRLNALISQLTHSHQHSQALQLFYQIHSSHQLKPDHYTLATTLSACATLRDTSSGKQIHAYAVRSGLQSYTHVINTLLSLYAKSNDLDSSCQLFDELDSPDVYSWTTLLSAVAKSGQINQALQLFDQLPQRSVPVWNALITGCVECGREEVAFDMFSRMHRLGVRHDHYSFASVLSLCCLPELLDSGKQVHSLALRTGFLARVSVVNALVTMYFNCGMIGDAYVAFEEADTWKNHITFNAMIAGLVSWERDTEALTMFVAMEESSFRPTQLTFMSILSACSSAKMAQVGHQMHTKVMVMGFEACVLVSNAMINMYSSCNNLPYARLVFERLREKDLISWNSMITGFAQANFCHSAIDYYKQMQMAGIEPDDFTFGSLLGCTENSEMIQALVVKNGLVSSTQVGNALISAFTNHGKIQYAYQVFGEMDFRNLISWNSIISGCLLNGFPLLGLELFYQMHIWKLKPNMYTLSIALGTCASISALRHGKQIHAYILRSELDMETSLGNPLITMYAKSGVLDCSSRVFCHMSKRDVVTWNAMIGAHAQHGEGKEAIRCFKAMKESGIEPDAVTFTILLSACSHAGLVDEGRWIFSSMVEDYRMEPNMDHYSCIIDLLGRAGLLEEAERLLNSMPFKMDSRVWWAVLSACRAHGNVRLGKAAAGCLLEIEPENPAVYVLLSNIYAAAGQWEAAASVRELMKRNGVLKKPGYSWMESQKLVQWY